jgi:type IV secretory pathway VirB4 component
MDLISGLIGLAALGGIGWSAKDTAAALRVSNQRTLSDFLPWRRLIRPSIVTTAADEYLTVFRFAARDVGTLSPSEVLEVAHRLAAAIGSLKPKPSIKLQFYAVRERATEYLRSQAPAHPILEVADEERERFFLEQEPGFNTVRYLSLAWRPSDLDLAELRSTVITNIDAALAIEQRLLVEFESLVSRLASSLNDAFATVERLGERSEIDTLGCERRRSALLEFLHYFVTGKCSSFNVPEDSVIELNGLLSSRGFAGRTATPKIGDDYVLPILLKTFPKEAELQVLDELTRIGVEHYFSVRYLPLTLADVQKETRDIVLDFQGQAKQNGSFVDPGAADSAVEVAHAHGAAKNAYTQFGFCTFSVVIRAASSAQLIAAKNVVLSVLEKAGFPNAYIPELGAWDAIAATFPGASRWSGVHKHLEHALGVATLLPLHEHDRGRRYNGNPYRLPETPPHFYAVARGHALTRVHTDVADVGHGFGLAPSSWGKSTFQSYLSLMRLARLPLSGTTMFDKGLASYRACLMADGTVYDPLGDRNAPGIALFDGVEDDAVAEAVLGLITEMIVGWIGKPTPGEDQSLRDAMRVIASIPSEYRSMTDFCRILQDDTHRLREVLNKFTATGGPLGRTLDSSHDTFATQRWTVVDLQHVFGLAPEYLVPLLRVLAWKTSMGANTIRRSFGDHGRFYQHTLNIDESHLLQKHPAGERMIVDTQKMGRALNLSVFLWSNGLDEMANTAGRTELLTQSRTRIYGGNPGATDHETRQLYRSLQLNERAVDMLPRLEPREFLLHQPDAGILQRLNARLDAPMLALIGDPRKNSDVDLYREMWPIERFGLHEWKIRLLEHDGQHAFAARLRAKIESLNAHETRHAVVETPGPAAA